MQVISRSTYPDGSLKFAQIAGVAQIVATSLMIHSFSLRNYAVGTVYSKTETVFVAIFSTFILHEPLKLLAWGGIFVCLSGVAILSVRGYRVSLASTGEEGVLSATRTPPDLIVLDLTLWSVPRSLR